MRRDYFLLDRTSFLKIYSQLPDLHSLRSVRATAAALGRCVEQTRRRWNDVLAIWLHNLCADENQRSWERNTRSEVITRSFPKSLPNIGYLRCTFVQDNHFRFSVSPLNGSVHLSFFSSISFLILCLSSFYPSLYYSLSFQMSVLNSSFRCILLEHLNLLLFTARRFLCFSLLNRLYYSSTRGGN